MASVLSSGWPWGAAGDNYKVRHIFSVHRAMSFPPCSGAIAQRPLEARPVHILYLVISIIIFVNRAHPARGFALDWRSIEYIAASIH